MCTYVRVYISSKASNVVENEMEFVKGCKGFSTEEDDDYIQFF